MANILAKEMIGLSFPPTMESKSMMRTKEFSMFSKNESVKTSNELTIWKRTIDSIFNTLNFMGNKVGKVKVLRVLDMIEHDSRACIYGALVSVDTNDIFLNNEFSILDDGRKIISKDNGRI
ncbi:hypothetical protein Tco_0072026 [Tanacetum coccineum]